MLCKPLLNKLPCECVCIPPSSASWLLACHPHPTALSHWSSVLTAWFCCPSRSYLASCFRGASPTEVSMDSYLKTSEGRQPGPLGRSESPEMGAGDRPLLLLLSSLFLFFSLIGSFKVKGFLNFPLAFLFKFHPSLGYSVLSEEREQHPEKAKKNTVLLEAQLWHALELLGPPRKRDGCCFKELLFHRMLYYRVFSCLSLWGPWVLPGISFADLLCVQEKGSCHQLPEGPVCQKLPSSLWPRKGLPFTVFWRVQVSDEGRKLSCPLVICYLASDEIRVQFSRAYFDSPENLSLHLIMRNSVLTWRFHRFTSCFPSPP